MDKNKQSTHSTETDRFEAIIDKIDSHSSCKGMSWIQLVLTIVTITSFILLGVLYIIRSENEPMKKDIEYMKEDIKEIKEACKTIKNDDELAYFIDARIELKGRQK